jgi:hypothetical protein
MRFVHVVCFVCIVFTGCASTDSWPGRVLDYRVERHRDGEYQKPVDGKSNLTILIEPNYGYGNMHIRAFTDATRPSKAIYFKEVSITKNGEKIVVIKNRSKKIRSRFNTRTGFYGNSSISPIIIKRIWPNIFFKGMKRGETMEIKLTQIYSIDDEPMQHETYTYTVECWERDRKLPWFLIFPSI